MYILSCAGAAISWWRNELYLYDIKTDESPSSNDIIRIWSDENDIIKAQALTVVRVFPKTVFGRPWLCGARCLHPFEGISSAILFYYKFEYIVKLSLGDKHAL